MNWILKPRVGSTSTSILHEHGKFLTRTSQVSSKSFACILCNSPVPEYIHTQIKLQDSYPTVFNKRPIAFFTKDMNIAGVYSPNWDTLHLNYFKYENDLRLLLLSYNFNINEVKALSVKDLPGYPL